MPSKLISALTAVSLMAAPTMAVAQAEPDVPSREERGNRGGNRFGQVIPLLAIIAIVLLIRQLVKDRDVGLEPRSP